MSEQGSLLGFLSDPRLAPYAMGDIPAWLWSADATRILWGNPAAAAIFNAASSTALTGHTIDPKGSAALQIARLAGTLPHGAAPRLERLRGFGGRMGGALMCTCSRISLADRTPAILVVATEGAGRVFRLNEQAQRLLAGCDEPAALFSVRRRAAARNASGAGKAWRRHKPRRARRRSRSPPPRSPPAAPRATMPTVEFRSNVSAPMHRRFCWRLLSRRAQPLPPSNRRPPRSLRCRAAERASAGRRSGDPPRRTTSPPRRSRQAEPRQPALRTQAERRQPLRFVWQMDDDEPLHARLRRIQDADRTANRRRARPAVERYRRRRWGSIPKARSPAPSPRATPGAASPSPSRSTEATRG